MLTLLETIAERVDDCLIAAWVDTRTGLVIERCAKRDDDFVAEAVNSAIEVMRSAERPPRMVLLSDNHVHIIQRTTHDPHRVLVVVCARSPNLGLAVSIVRMTMDAETS
jgi:predicted nuclease of predicted toxin-antitoxin system